MLSKVFGLFPDSIILVEDGYVETVDTDGRFHNVDALPMWTVTGDWLQTHAALSGGGPEPSGINPYSYQLPVATASKKGRGKSPWTPTYAMPMYGLQQPPGVRANRLSELSNSKTAALKRAHSAVHTPSRVEEINKSLQVE